MTNCAPNIILFPKKAGDTLSTAERLAHCSWRIMQLEEKIANLENDPSLRKNERNAIRSLAAFAAEDSGISREEVLDGLRKRFNACDINDIRSKDYNDVVMFLIRLEETTKKT